MTHIKWRRTNLAPDDWTLLDPSGEPLARLYNVSGGPQDGRWYWSVLFRRDGGVGNGGNGFAVTGREAREACEGAHAGNEVIDEGTTILAELVATAGRTDIRLAI
jgi:hypothetical protein